MKKPSASRLKKLPLLLGTLLIISVAAYGTRAYFSDSTTQQADIKLELGNVKIATMETAWVHKGNKNDIVSSEISIDDETSYTSYTNVKPGDSFTREYTIRNTGTLDVKVGLTYKNKSNSNNPINLDKLSEDQINISNQRIDGTPYSLTINGFQNNLTLVAEEGKKENEISEVKYTVTISVPTTVDKDFVEDLDTVVSDFLDDTLIITAEQIKE